MDKHKAKESKKEEVKHDPKVAEEVLSNLSHIKIAKAESNPETWAQAGVPQGTQLYTAVCTKEGAGMSAGGRTQVQQFVLEHTH